MSAIDLHSTYGAMLIGTFFATFFQGLLSLQAYSYYENFPEDSWQLKTLVGVVWCLDLTHLILICQSCYHYLVDNWGNEAALLESTIELDMHLLLVGAATIVCQAFFLRRVWNLSKKNWLLVGCLAAMCMTTLVLDVAMAIRTSLNRSVATFSDWGDEILALFAIGAAVDVIIAMLLCWYLPRGGRTSFSSTNFVVSRIIQYTVATGLATSLLAVGCFVAYLIQPKGFVFIAMHFSLGRMYTNALLATLNSRRNLRAALGLAGGGVSRTTALEPQSPPPAFTVVSQDYALTDIENKPRSKPGVEATW